MTLSHASTACALLMVVGCTAEEKGAPARPPVPVTVAAVVEREFAEELVALGTLGARESVEVTANVTEKIARISFEGGQTVRAGQTLVELVRNEEKSRLDKARAELDGALNDLQRTETLAKDAIVTAADLDNQRVRVESARAVLKTAEAQLDDRLVRAPFDGVVGLRRVSPGSLVTPSTVITTLDAIDTLHADLALPERFIALVKGGETVVLSSDAYPDETFTGKVVAVDVRVDPATRSIQVRALVDNPEAKLRPGMLVRGTLRVGTRRSAAVPENAIVQRAYRAMVYRLTANGESPDSTVELVEVKLGRRQPGWVEILSGLKSGDRVVVEGLNRVKPGAVVEVKE